MTASADSTSVPTRRAFFAHAALSGLAATQPPIFTVPAVADAAILALGPVIAGLVIITDQTERDASAAYETVAEMVGPSPVKPRDIQCFPTSAAYHKAKQRYDEECAIVATRRREAEAATSLDALDEAADEANAAEAGKFAELAAMRATTVAGLIVKAQWANRRDWEALTRSIVDDLLAMA